MGVAAGISAPGGFPGLPPSSAAPPPLQSSQGWGGAPHAPGPQQNWGAQSAPAQQQPSMYPTPSAGPPSSAASSFPSQQGGGMFPGAALGGGTAQPFSAAVTPAVELPAHLQVSGGDGCARISPVCI